MTLYNQFMKGKSLASAGLAAVIILAIILVVVVFVIILQDGQRKIAVQYSQRIQGRRSVGGQSSFIPLKVNTAGVVPVIFASSLMQFPVVIASFLGKGNGKGIGSEILKGLSSNNWCNPEQLKYSWGLILYIVLTVFFAYFYTSITFNPLEIANNMKKERWVHSGYPSGKTDSRLSDKDPELYHLYRSSRTDHCTGNSFRIQWLARSKCFLRRNISDHYRRCCTGDDQTD